MNTKNLHHIHIHIVTPSGRIVFVVHCIHIQALEYEYILNIFEYILQANWSGNKTVIGGTIIQSDQHGVPNPQNTENWL
jgi:Na+/alanine symporter